MNDKGDGMKSIAMVMAFVFAGLAVSGVQAEIYFWTDENGVKHYSHAPPPDRSLPVDAAPEIKPDPTTDREIEKINEENIDAVLEALEKEEQAAGPKSASAQKPFSVQDRIAAEREKLEEKIAWVEQLPPEAFTNSRSKQAIIGRYRYRMDLLDANPDEYFKNYPN
jgi:hypothetical protein